MYSTVIQEQAERGIIEKVTSEAEQGEVRTLHTTPCSNNPHKEYH